MENRSPTAVLGEMATYLAEEKFGKVPFCRSPIDEAILSIKAQAPIPPKEAKPKGQRGRFLGTGGSTPKEELDEAGAAGFVVFDRYGVPCIGDDAPLPFRRR